MKNLYLVHQTENNDYDTFDSFVVCAASEEEARAYHPEGVGSKWGDCWCSSPDRAIATLIGTASHKFGVGDVVIASFNAG